MTDYRPGDVVNGHVFTGVTWVPIEAGEAQESPPPPPASSQQELHAPPNAGDGSAIGANVTGADGSQLIGQDGVTHRGTTESVEVVAPPWWRRTGVLVVGAVLVVGFIIILIVTQGNNPRPSGVAAESTAANLPLPSPSPTPVPETPWYPAGFNQSPDPGIAFTWDPSSTEPCPSYLDICKTIEVVAQYGCPSGVFVEMALADANGVLGDTTNQIGPAMQAGQHALITVGWMNPSANATQYQLTRLSCM